VVRLRSKLSIISGTSGPMILVRKEMTKKVSNINPIIKIFLFIGSKVFCGFAYCR
jgi:hypothetical protein